MVNKFQIISLMYHIHFRRRRREREENQRQPRRWWVKPWVQRRQMQGQYYHLFEELDRETLMDYKGYIRIDRELFAEILQRVGPRITKSTRYVQVILAIIFVGVQSTYMYFSYMLLFCVFSGAVLRLNPARS